MANNKISEVPALILVGVGVLAIYLLYKLVVFASKLFVYLGFNIFLFIDNLVKVDSFNPVVTWGLLGLLIGSIVGVIIAIKKYKLSKLLALIPLTVLIICVTILALVNKPTTASGTFSPPSTQEPSSYTDSPKVVSYFTVNRTLFARAAPSWSSNKLFSISKGRQITFIKNVRDSRKNIWSLIEYSDPQTGITRTGYVLASYLSRY